MIQDSGCLEIQHKIGESYIDNQIVNELNLNLGFDPERTPGIIDTWIDTWQCTIFLLSSISNAFAPLLAK
jgi:hypothetical protein